MKLVSVNIELDRHLPLVEDFLRKEQPDVVCLQEVYEPDFEDMKSALAMEGVFGVMGKRESEKRGEVVNMGVCVLSKNQIESVRRDYYSGDEQIAHTIFQPENAQEYCHAVVSSVLREGGVDYTVGTTHFTWTPDGQAEDVQRAHLVKLVEVLRGIPELVLCGDFNAPRGGEIFSALAQHYKDNIPEYYTTSIDTDLHRNGSRMREEKLMVDGLFTTPSYRARNARLVPGVSDHMAIVADIERV